MSFQKCVEQFEIFEWHLICMQAFKVRISRFVMFLTSIYFQLTRLLSMHNPWFVVWFCFGFFFNPF